MVHKENTFSASINRMANQTNVLAVFVFDIQNFERDRSFGNKADLFFTSLGTALAPRILIIFVKVYIFLAKTLQCAVCPCEKLCIASFIFEHAEFYCV